ncbi:Pyridoxal phosphate phosphatase YigL [compost metagenome]
MIKLLVSDLDGTLLDHSKQVVERDLLALRQAKEQGIDLCIASGRMHSEIQQVTQSIGKSAHSVSQNGAFVHLEDGSSLHAKLFNAELASQIYEHTHSFDLVRVVCSADSNYINQITPASDLIQTRAYEAFRLRADLNNGLLTDLSCSKFSFFSSMEVLLEVKDYMERQFGDQIAMFVSEHDCLDIMPQHVSKGNSLLTLLNEIGLKPDEIACVGDSFNDISMFGLTRHSFVMDSAHPEVQQAATHQVQSVAEAVQYVLSFNASLRSTR